MLQITENIRSVAADAEGRGPSWGVRVSHTGRSKRTFHLQDQPSISSLENHLRRRNKKKKRRRRNHFLSLAPNQYVSSSLTRYKGKMTLLKAYIKIEAGCSFKNDRRL